MNLKSGAHLQGGRYRIISTLGRGGFGITYLAEHTMTRRRVCIKEYFPKDYYKRNEDATSIALSSDGFAESMNRYKVKFVKEAQTIATFSHPNIVPIHDAFEENDTAYYVMEYVEGGSLSDIVKGNGALDEATAVDYVRQIASALSYIHERRFMHLDIKPGNIMLRTSDERAMLIDFGLSKHYNDDGEQTSTTPVGISHGYAPFEQYKDGGVSIFSPATDIYSLGATLYYLVTGSVPPSATDIAKGGINTPTNLSPGVQRAIKEAMNYWREDRPQSIDDFLKLLDDEPEVVAPIAENTIIEVEPKHDDEATIIDVEPTQTAQPAPQPKNEPKPKKEQKSKRGLWLGIFLFVVAAVASFILFGGGSSKKESAPKSAVATVDTPQLNESPTQKELKPELILESDSEVILPYDGGSGEIKYTITNPVDGEIVKYATDAKWLTIKHRDGVVSFTAQANTTGKDRNATVTLTYCGQSVEVNIYQYLLPFNEIWYTSSDGKVVKPSKEGKDIFGAEIESNTYKNGKGIIKFKGNVTTIGVGAFFYCGSLTSITIPSSVTTIGNQAFERANLTSVTIPNSVTTIGYSAFRGCSRLTSVTIPNSVTTIGEGAFYLCGSLTSVTIPNSVTTIGRHAFCACSNLKEFKGGSAFINGRCLIINGKLVAFAPAGITKYTIPDSVTTIGDDAFYGCDNLTSVTIPNSVKTIGDRAFWGCDNLTSVTIPNSVTTIGLEAFCECKSLTSVTIPNSVTTIGGSAFSHCESLTSVTIPDSVTKIGEWAFCYCKSLKSVTIQNRKTTIGNKAFYECDNLSEETRNNIKSINPNAKF